jgi:alanine-glyoxylate transaminase/serine-glyoxylate transaminase/serine-pyruvate transaminase
MDVVAKRKEPVRSFYVDVSMLRNYWGSGQARVYHHTPPMTMLYALREALAIALEEGVEARIVRHKRNADAFCAGVEAMGLQLHAQTDHRLPSLTTVRVPEGVEELAIRRGLLQEHEIEVGGGIGALQGQVWRVGLMGYNSTARNVLALLYALGTELTRAGAKVDTEAGVAAAVTSLNTDL